jgi:pyruvate-formate lyase-activating enzyme
LSDIRPVRPTTNQGPPGGRAPAGSSRLERSALYRFPWSKPDNAGAWVEVTDECTFSCRGCYRHKIEGHRPLEAVLQDIRDCRRITNCDGMAIAGGEPLIYPRIVDVVAYMSGLKIKPTILSNGEKLTPALAKELKKAGLAKIHLHVDSAQNRPGWEGRNEIELNELRRQFADLLHRVGGIQCGYHVTVFRHTLPFLPAIVEWCKRNIDRVQHISFIAFRTLPNTPDVAYYAAGRRVRLETLGDVPHDPQETSITAEEMLGGITARHPDFEPAAFLNGSSNVETFKYLIGIYIGSRHGIYGTLGAKTVELVQVAHHILTGRYLSFLRSPVVGRKLFALALVDASIRQALGTYIRACVRDLRHLVVPVYAQSIHLHQPNELLDGRVNLCDSCLNMMVHRGRLISSCRLDEYRVYGAAIVPAVVR